MTLKFQYKNYILKVIFTMLVVSYLMRVSHALPIDLTCSEERESELCKHLNNDKYFDLELCTCQPCWKICSQHMQLSKCEEHQKLGFCKNYSQVTKDVTDTSRATPKSASSITSTAKIIFQQFQEIKQNATVLEPEDFSESYYKFTVVLFVLAGIIILLVFFISILCGFLGGFTGYSIWQRKKTLNTSDPSTLNGTVESNRPITKNSITPKPLHTNVTAGQNSSSLESHPLLNNLDNENEKRNDFKMQRRMDGSRGSEKSSSSGESNNGDTSSIGNCSLDWKLDEEPSRTILSSHLPKNIVIT